MFFNIFFPCQTSNTSPWDRTFKGQGLGWKLYCSPFFLWKGEKKVMNCYLSPWKRTYIYTYIHNIYIYNMFPPGKIDGLLQVFIWVAFFARPWVPHQGWKRSCRMLICSNTWRPPRRFGSLAFGWMVSWNYAYLGMWMVLSKWMMENP